MDKKKFRKYCKDKLKQNKNIYYKSKVTEKKLYTFLKQKKETVLLYLPMSEEVNVLPLLKKLRRRGHDIVIPKMMGESFIAVRYGLPLKRSRFGISETKHVKNPIRKKIAVAVVPLLGMDAKFGRVGFGKGMYDRFYAKQSPKPLTLFTQLSACLTSHEVTNTYDVIGDLYFSFELVCERRNYGISSPNRVVYLPQRYGASGVPISQKGRRR